MPDVLELAPVMRLSEIKAEIRARVWPVIGHRPGCVLTSDQVAASPGALLRGAGDSGQLMRGSGDGGRGCEWDGGERHMIPTSQWVPEVPVGMGFRGGVPRQFAPTVYSHLENDRRS